MKAYSILDLIFDELPPEKGFAEGIRRAPKRRMELDGNEIVLAVKNALRYIPEKYHEIMAEEFYNELMITGRIYGYRFRPEGRIYGRPIWEYKGNCQEAKAIQVMIDNNLDFDIALYPYELVTYGESGQVCQNWMQYNLIKKYLEIMNDEQTLVVSSGHPVGLFKSRKDAPRVILTNGPMVGKYDNFDDWNRASALGVTNYGQFTAGGWFYIGSQGIVHGTYMTLLSAGREILGIPKTENLKGYLFVSSGLGGMSGAQGKAVEIAGGVGIIAEVDYSKILLRQKLGWISKLAETPQDAFSLAQEYQKSGIPMSVAYYGNVVDLLKYALENNIKIDLLTDQTSCHAVYDGGYCPYGITYEAKNEMLANDRKVFEEAVKEGLKIHYKYIKKLVERGTYFFDYGNSFISSLYEIGINEICVNGKNALDGFKYKSFVEEFVGPLLFDFGYGPFRWVCLSGKDEDLRKTDNAAMNCIDPNRRFQDYDNYMWIKHAEENRLVTGTKARILYQDAEYRKKIAFEFNRMVRDNEVGPIMLGRDHFDSGGVDCPTRETSNIRDGSNITADMAIQCFGGNTSRGMTFVSLHNGGGTGIGNSISCGYGLLLDGSERVDKIIENAIEFDVVSGVARRAWARNGNSIDTCMEFNLKKQGESLVTIPNICREEVIQVINKKYNL